MTSGPDWLCGTVRISLPTTKPAEKLVLMREDRCWRGSMLGADRSL